MSRPRHIASFLIITIVLSACPSGQCNSTSYRRRPAIWDANAKRIFKAFVGKTADWTTEGAGGTYQTTSRKRVDGFLRALGHKTLVGDRARKYFANQEIPVPAGEEPIVIYGDVFQTEAIMSAMLVSGLFRNIQPVQDGAGGGPAGSDVAIDRSALFKDPLKPSRRELADELEGFFTGYFSDGTRRIDISTENAETFRYGIHVAQVRNFVFSPRAGYWEDIEVYVTASPKFGQERDGVVVTFQLYCKYAAGVGASPPPPKKYKIADEDSAEVEAAQKKLARAFEKSCDNRAAQR